MFTGEKESKNTINELNDQILFQAQINFMKTWFHVRDNSKLSFLQVTVNNCLVRSNFYYLLKYVLKDLYISFD